MKRVLALVFTLMVLINVNAKAVGLGVGGQLGFGLSSFAKPVGDLFGGGLAFGVHGDLNIIKYVSVRLSFDYGTYSSDKEKIKQFFNAPQGTEISGLNAGVFGITVGGLGKVPTGSLVTPYGLLGLGIHILSIGDGKATVPGFPAQDIKVGLDSQTKFGIHFGAGTEFALNKLVLFFEFKYVLVFTEGSSSGLIPIMVGATYNIM